MDFFLIPNKYISLKFLFSIYNRSSFEQYLYFF